MIRADSVAELAVQLRSLGSDMGTGVSSARRRLAELEWDDANGLLFAEMLATSLAHFEYAAHRFLSHGQWLSALSSRVEDLANGCRLSARPARASTQRLQQTSAVQPGPFERLRGMPAVKGAPGGKVLRLLDMKRFCATDFDWLEENPDAAFENLHHTRTPADYLALVERIPEMLGALSEGNPMTPAQEESLGLFFSSEPICVERKDDGRIDIINGRHRLWAALRSGLSVPVLVLGSDD